MNHERFEELKDAYALGALPDEEQREMEEYFSDNPALRAEVEELTSISKLLAFSPTEYDPPPTLRRNIMSVVESEADRREQATDSQSTVQRLRTSLGLQKFALGAAAVALVALLSWNILLQTQDSDLQTYQLQNSDSSTEVKAEVVEINEGQFVLTAENMSRMPEDKTLQIWVIEDGEPKPAGTFRPEDGVAAAPVTAPIRGAETLAVTVEPEGGSEQPTTDPVMQTEL